jgi:hypothetical protein
MAVLHGVAAEMVGEGLARELIVCVPLVGRPGMAKGKTQEDVCVVWPDASAIQIWWMGGSVHASRSVSIMPLECVWPVVLSAKGNKNIEIGLWILAKTTSTRASQGTPLSSSLHHGSRAKLVVVDRWEVVMLRPRMTNVGEQQPTPMMRTIDRKS